MTSDTEQHHDEPDSQDADQAVEYGVPDKFAVRDEGSANWVIRKVVEAKAYAQRVATWAEQEKLRAQRQEAFFMQRYGPQLHRWVRQQIAERGGKRKCLDLPAGRVGFRQQKEKMIVEDDARALAWAKTHCPTAVKVQESLLKAELNEHVQATGELPEGVRLEPEHESFYVK